MKIYRAIFLDHIEDLDIDNFGCHWTKNENFWSLCSFRFHDISENKRKGEICFNFVAEVDEECFDTYLTAKSNKDYFSEKEVFIKPNTIIKCVKVNNQEDEILIDHINTGNRFDKWTI